MKKIALLSVIVIVIILQFIPVKIPENKETTQDDIVKAGYVNEDISIILKTSCYDCHSNQSKYPWYSYVAPVKWLVVRDVSKGREELNFSEWNSFDNRRKIRKLGEIKEQIDKGEMPMSIYTAIHRSAKLSNDQKNVLIAWTEEEQNRIMNQ